MENNYTTTIKKAPTCGGKLVDSITNKLASCNGKKKVEEELLNPLLKFLEANKREKKRIEEFLEALEEDPSLVEEKLDYRGFVEEWCEERGLEVEAIRSEEEEEELFEEWFEVLEVHYYRVREERNKDLEELKSNLKLGIEMLEEMEDYLGDKEYLEVMDGWDSLANSLKRNLEYLVDTSLPPCNAWLLKSTLKRCGWCGNLNY